jgi:hypothetical protein
MEQPCTQGCPVAFSSRWCPLIEETGSDWRQRDKNNHNFAEYPSSEKAVCHTTERAGTRAVDQGSKFSFDTK